ncbi:hypothetical protein ACFWAN_27475 [Streptomyces mirabilis]|uniref:hypothetical protein n=1 Tax=Streptomyces mirabilis TaxID=68239 RepID=UPI0036694037
MRLDGLVISSLISISPVVLEVGCFNADGSIRAFQWSVPGKRDGSSYSTTAPAGALATARLIRQTPSLRARNLEKQCGWRPLLAGAASAAS